LHDPAATSFDGFGDTVALSGTTVGVGAGTTDVGAGVGAGVAHIFDS
jgi:hypothetical protein